MATAANSNRLYQSPSLHTRVLSLLTGRQSDAARRGAAEMALMASYQRDGAPPTDFGGAGVSSVKARTTPLVLAVRGRDASPVINLTSAGSQRLLIETQPTSPRIGPFTRRTRALCSV